MAAEGNRGVKQVYEKRKLYHLQPRMGHIKITEDSDCRLYLSLVQGKITQDKEHRWLKRVGQVLARLVISISVVVLLYVLLRPFVYAQRGYDAYGGECMLEMLGGIATFKISGERGV